MNFLQISPKKWSLRLKILLITGAFLIAGIVALSFFVSFILEDTLKKSVEERLALIEYSIKDEINIKQEMLLSLVASVASIPEVLKYLSEKDRKSLMSFILPYNERVRNMIAKRSLFFHFHTPPGTSFLRTWNINEWGEDLTKTRMMVVRANSEFISFAGIDKGQRGLSLRAIVPIINGINHIGSVEAGITLEEVFQAFDLPIHYGIAVAFKGDDKLKKSDDKEIKFIFGIDADNAIKALKEEKLAGNFRYLFFKKSHLNNFQGQNVGDMILFFDGYGLLQDKMTKVYNFLWMAIAGSVAMWLFLYFSMFTIRSFFTQLKQIILSSEPTNFTSNFKMNHIHCREILKCENESCLVYKNTSLICYLEKISGIACNFLEKYKTCNDCPVYHANQKNEISEIKWILNYLIRTWNFFLVKSTDVFTRVFGSLTSTGETLSLNQVTNYLEKMGQITSYSHDIRGVLDKSEVYRIISFVVKERFNITNYVIIEVCNNEDRMEIVAGNLSCNSDKLSNITFDSNLCRSNRIAEDVCSYNNHILCPFFNCDYSKEFRTCLPVLMGGRVGAIFSFVAPIKEWQIWRDQIFIIKRYLDVTAPVLSSIRLLQLTKEQALHDPLTKCNNRLFLDEYIKQYEPLVKRSQKKVGFIMADIDYFKQVNDQYGHPTGDFILQQVSEIIKNNIRESDLIIRYGGEEFLILILEIDSNSTQFVGEKIRSAIETFTFEISNGVNIKKTISIGTSEYPSDATMFYKSIKYADVALYEAKRQGRNRVVNFEPGMWNTEEY